VKQWIDYSDKYGLGYCLVNGCNGVYFNDSSKIVMNSEGTYFEYSERLRNEKQDTTTVYPFSNYPKEL